MDESGSGKPPSGNVPLTGEAAARALAASQEASTSSKGEDELDESFLDFAEHYRQEFRSGAPQGFGNTHVSDAQQVVPPRFEDISLCADCRFCHAVRVPVNVRMPVGETGQRAALGMVRRCLLGLKLPSDDGPETLTTLRSNARMAPLAVECSHFSPWTDDELADREMRLQQHQERQRLRREAQAALDDNQEEET